MTKQETIQQIEEARDNVRYRLDELFDLVQEVLDELAFDEDGCPLAEQRDRRHQERVR